MEQNVVQCFLPTLRSFNRDREGLSDLGLANELRQPTRPESRPTPPILGERFRCSDVGVVGHKTPLPRQCPADQLLRGVGHPCLEYCPDGMIGIAEREAESDQRLYGLLGSC